jgi:hypothetical protein
MKRKSFQANLWHDGDLDPALVEALWEDPNGLIESGTSVKDGDRCTVVRLEHEMGPLIFKRYNLKGPVHTSVHAVMRSRAAWCLLNAHRVRGAGLRTPRPLACLEMRRGVLRGTSFFLNEFISGPTLLHLIRDTGVEPERLERLAADFARIWKTLGRLRLGHGDMKAANFIVDADDRLWLIDLDGMRRYPAAYGAPLLVRQRTKDYERFMRNWRPLPPVETAFQLAVVRAQAEAAEFGPARGLEEPVEET